MTTGVKRKSDQISPPQEPPFPLAKLPNSLLGIVAGYLPPQSAHLLCHVLSRKVTDLSKKTRRTAAEIPSGQVEEAGKFRFVSPRKMLYQAERNHTYFIKAVDGGRTDIVKEMLLETTLPSRTIQEAFALAAEKGNNAMLELLDNRDIMDKKSQPTILSNTLKQALSNAMNRGHIRMTERLLNVYLSMEHRRRGLGLADTVADRLINIARTELGEVHQKYLETGDMHYLAIYRSIIRRILDQNTQMSVTDSAVLLNSLLLPIREYSETLTPAQEAILMLMNELPFSPDAIRNFVTLAIPLMPIAPFFNTPHAPHFDLMAMFERALNSRLLPPTAKRASIVFLLNRIQQPISGIQLAPQHLEPWLDDPEMVELLLYRMPLAQHINLAQSAEMALGSARENTRNGRSDLARNYRRTAEKIIHFEAFTAGEAQRLISCVHLCLTEPHKARLLNFLKEKHQIDPTRFLGLCVNAQEHLFGEPEETFS